MKRILFVASFFALLLTGCEKLKPVLTVDPESFTFYVDGKGQITTNVEDASFSSDDEFYASVSETGAVTANKVGQTNITVNSSIGSLKVPVTVLPKYDLYPDMDGLIGKTRSAVEALLGTPFSSSTDKNGICCWVIKTSPILVLL